jgi:hypothetical protein
MPVCWRSPNRIDPTCTFTAFLMAVLAGARRVAHSEWLRGDRVVHTLLGLERFPIDDTIRNPFRRFGMKEVQEFFEPLSDWQMQRLLVRSDGYTAVSPLLVGVGPGMQRLLVRSDGYTLDFDSTVFERYGQQEGSLKGHNPRKHGRPSHHPLLAVLAEAHFLLHGWLRSGNCGAARGAVEFLKEALALWGPRQKIR